MRVRFHCNSSATAIEQSRKASNSSAFLPPLNGNICLGIRAHRLVGGAADALLLIDLDRSLKASVRAVKTVDTSSDLDILLEGEDSEDADGLDGSEGNGTLLEVSV